MCLKDAFLTGGISPPLAAWRLLVLHVVEGCRGGVGATRFGIQPRGLRTTRAHEPLLSLQRHHHSVGCAGAGPTTRHQLFSLAGLAADLVTAAPAADYIALALLGRVLRRSKHTTSAAFHGAAP